jgi:hypothetical protein
MFSRRFFLAAPPVHMFFDFYIVNMYEILLPDHIRTNKSNATVSHCLNKTHCLSHEALLGR